MKRSTFFAFLLPMLFAGLIALAAPEKVVSGDASPLPGSRHVDEFAGSVAIKPDGVAELKTNQVFSISLDENQSIPYRWQPGISDGKLVALLHSEPKWDKIASNMPGASGGYRVFYFKALSAGECTIAMTYADVRDKTVDLTKIYTIIITE